jgi:hypothetical protein
VTNTLNTNHAPKVNKYWPHPIFNSYGVVIYHLAVDGSYHMRFKRFVTIVVEPTEILPVVTKLPGVALVNTKPIITAPVTGGVMVATLIVPLTNVSPVDGAIVVVLAMVAGKS